MHTLLKNGIEISDTDMVALEDSLLDPEEWVRNALLNKVYKCKRRLVTRGRDLIARDPSVTNVPAQDDAFVDFVTSLPGYKNRVKRDAVGKLAK